MGKATWCLRLGFSYNENCCVDLVCYMSLVRGFWRMGTWMDHGELQSPSFVCYASVSNSKFMIKFDNILTRSTPSFPLVMNIVQFWIVDTIVKHKSIMPIRLNGDEEIAEDMLVSDGEYTPLPNEDIFFDGSDVEDAVDITSSKVHHSSATKAQLHRSLSNSSSVSADSLYELRTSSGYIKTTK